MGPFHQRITSFENEINHLPTSTLQMLIEWNNFDSILFDYRIYLNDFKAKEWKKKWFNEQQIARNLKKKT